MSSIFNFFKSFDIGNTIFFSKFQLKTCMSNVYTFSSLGTKIIFFIIEQFDVIFTKNDFSYFSKFVLEIYKKLNSILKFFFIIFIKNKFREPCIKFSIIFYNKKECINKS